MKRRKTFTFVNVMFFLLLAICSLFFIIACQKPLGFSGMGKDRMPDSQPGMGYLRLVLDGTNARTIMPAPGLDQFTSYTLAFTGPLPLAETQSQPLLLSCTD